MYENYCKIRDQRGYKDADVAKATGITKSTFSDWKSGRSHPKNEKLQKIADFFDVSIEYMMTGETPAASGQRLNSRDKKEINDILSETEQLLKQDGLMFDGKPASPEAINSIISAMRVGMEMAKENNKKYIPDKYKRE